VNTDGEKAFYYLRVGIKNKEQFMGDHTEGVFVSSGLVRGFLGSKISPVDSKMLKRKKHKKRVGQSRHSIWMKLEKRRAGEMGKTMFGRGHQDQKNYKSEEQRLAGELNMVVCLFVGDRV